MEWVILSVLVVSLAGLAWLGWRELRAQRRLLLQIQAASTQQVTSDCQDLLAAPLMDAGSAWVPTDKESAAVESRLRSESTQRAGSVRSRRSSTPTRG